MKANIEIRQATKKAGIHFWEVAEEYGMLDSNFSRMLRHELPCEKKEEILAIIKKLSREE